jgi:SAM-dependent methyltransferase
VENNAPHILVDDLLPLAEVADEARRTNASLPRGFDAKTYLQLNPDVRAAGADAAHHYLSYGWAEGRQYLLAADRFTNAAPSNQNIVDIFRGEWSSAVPGLNVSPGKADVFNHDLIAWMDQIFCIKDQNILELGPLEGGHSFALQSMGARSVTAIEANERAFLKCLCIKEIFGLSRVSFKFGDFMKYFETATERFDIIVASGVLYHMTEPLKLLSEIAKRSDRILLWSHVYDKSVVAAREDQYLFGTPEIISFEGNDYRCVQKDYARAALDWSGFSGGTADHAVWLARQSLLNFFANSGFETKINFDHPTHPNGPALALCATRKR